jgi:hypothetical protein
MTKQTATPTPPKGLSTAAQRWWHELQRDYPLNDSAGALLLEQALRAFDRCEEARASIDAEGAILKDRFGQAVAHPGLKIERDSRHQMFVALKALNLDIAPAKPPGRPLGS